MRLLTFNHHSIDEASSIDEVNAFFLELSKGIKKYIVKNGVHNSRFFSELEDFIKYEIVKGYKIMDAIKSLSRDLKSIIFDLITMKCNDDCLNKLSEEDMDKVTDYEIMFEDEAPGKDYMILSFVLEKQGILLSFNRDRWMKNSIEILKYKNGITDKLNIDNIATEKHAITLINKVILERLPNDNITYSESFREWLLEIDSIHIEKTIEKIIFVASVNFQGGRENLIEHITTDKIHNLKEIIIGTAGGMSWANIRVFFKSVGDKHYIYHGFIKQNEKNQDQTYKEEVIKTVNIIKSEKLNGL